MADDLEELGKEYDSIRDQFVKSVASRLQSLSEKIGVYGLEPVFLRTYIDFCEERHSEARDDISGSGISGYNSLLEEHKYTFDAFAKEYVYNNGARATIKLLKRTEDRINRKLMQKQSRELEGKLDFSDFFLENKVVWLNPPEKSDEESWKDLAEAIAKHGGI
jgi:ERCC4-related helicase